MAIATAPGRRAAEIVVTGVGGEDRLARSLLRAELAGVRYASVAAHEQALSGADMLVFVASRADVPDRAFTLALAAAARDAGILVAALIAGGENAGENNGESELLATLREAADMVVLVNDAGDVAPIVGALR